MHARQSATPQLVLAALMTALTAVCAQVQIPLPAVPLSLATLGACLCGALLPPRFAALAMAAYVLLGAIGVPVYAGFAAGPSVLFGPTGGYLFGYIPLAVTVSLILRRTGRSFPALALAMAAGTAICYALGTAWFMAVTGTGLSAAVVSCVLPFLPSDGAKIALAATLAMRLNKAIHTS